MKRFRITYRDFWPGSPLFSMVVRAEDADEARDRFYLSADAEGWEIVSVKLAR